MEKEMQNPDEAQKFTRLPGHDYKRIILLFSIVLIILAIPLVIYFIQQNQDTRQRAETFQRPFIDSSDFATAPETAYLRTPQTTVSNKGQKDGPCTGTTAGQCQVDTFTQIKDFDPNNNELLVTKDGNYWRYAPNTHALLDADNLATAGETAYLRTTGQTTVSGKTNQDGPCAPSNLIGGKCQIATITHIKDFDTGSNELLITANGKYWRYGPLANGVRPFIDAGDLATAGETAYLRTTGQTTVSGKTNQDGPCAPSNLIGGKCQIATITHIKDFDTGSNELLITANGKYWRYGPLANGVRPFIDAGDLATAGETAYLRTTGQTTVSGKTNQDGPCAGKTAGQCQFKTIDQFKDFDTGQNILLFSGNGRYAVFGPLPATTTTATGTPAVGSPTPTLVVNPTTGAFACQVGLDVQQINDQDVNVLPNAITPNTPIHISVTKNNPAPADPLWQYSTLYELNPDGSVKNNFGGCPNGVCTFLAAQNTPGTHRVQLAVRDFETYPTPGVKMSGQTTNKIWCAGTLTLTTLGGGTNTPTPPTGTGTLTPTATPAPGSIQVQFNDNIKLEGNSNNGQVLGTPPITPIKTLSVELYDANDDTTLVGKGSGSIAYNRTSTNFGTGTGVIWVAPIAPATSIPAGTYRVKVKADKYLKKWAPGTITIPANPTTPIAVSTTTKPIILSAGDISNINLVDLIGYNALIDCGAAVNNPLPKTNPVSGALTKYVACQRHLTTDPSFNVAMLDLNDDGDINSIDYAMLTGNLLNRFGD